MTTIATIPEVIAVALLASVVIGLVITYIQRNVEDEDEQPD